MKRDDLARLGSRTAISGFRNEDDVVAKFNNWKSDHDAQEWLVIMDYELEEIEYVRAVKLSGHKTDVQVQVTIKLQSAIDVENLQVKLVSNLTGYNQIDKRWVDRYAKLWNMPKDVITILKRFTGELPPNIVRTKDPRRMHVNEFSAEEQKILLDFIRTNRVLIVNDILKGRGKFAAEWMLVIQKLARNARWVLRPMNYAINYFGGGDVKVGKRGSIKIGSITMQRKGGDAGRNTANMLQFKINPAKLFES